MARLLATIGILCLAVFATPAAAACATMEDLTQRLATELPDAGVTLAEGEAADKVAIGIAQRTGAAVPAGGDYLLIDLPNGQLTYVVRFAGGCATHHGSFATELVRGWLAGRSAEGER